MACRGGDFDATEDHFGDLHVETLPATGAEGEGLDSSSSEFWLGSASALASLPKSWGGTVAEPGDKAPSAPVTRERSSSEEKSQSDPPPSLPHDRSACPPVPWCMVDSTTQRRAQELRASLMNLRAHVAWAEWQQLSDGEDLQVLEQLTELPLQWIQGWGSAYDYCYGQVSSDFPPTGAGWVRTQCSPEDDGFSGEIYSTYISELHSVEIRSDLLMTASFQSQYEGLMEPDLGAKVLPHIFLDAQRTEQNMPGNFLLHLVVKLPLLPKWISSRWCRDIVLHRQVIQCGSGVAGLEYSPKCAFKESCHCPACTCYFQGGTSVGTGFEIPPCKVSGRDAQWGIYWVEPKVIGGKEFVRYRNFQSVEIMLPRWVPVPKSWFTTAAAFILRRTLREFCLARQDPSNDEVYRQRREEFPSWYTEELYRRSGDKSIGTPLAGA